MAIELRAFFVLDQLQPQHSIFVGSVADGFLPLTGDSCLYVEIAPGIEVFRLVDRALKSGDVRPGMQVVERQYGMLEVHSGQLSNTNAAADAILDELGLSLSDRLAPRLLGEQTIHRVDEYQAQLLNRTKRAGQMLLAGESLYVMELEPAAYASLVVNECEKAANINLIGVRPFGAVGRVFLGGDEENIAIAQRTALQTISGLQGMP